MTENLTMLIVDDVEMNREILKMIFADEYKLVEADNGVSALQALHDNESIDIILLDIIMPKMDGIEFLKIIKKKPKFASIPVIVNTQQGEAENEVSVLDLGAEDFIVKPYNPRIVSRRVRNIVQKSVLERKQMKEDLKFAQEQAGESLKELKFRAEHDWLTGIYNRSTFYKKTEQMLRKNPQESYVLVVWNIEGFKVINDLFGTKVGDDILIRLARKFEAKMKGIGTYGRLEADHFATCFPSSFFADQSENIEEALDLELSDLHSNYPVVTHIGIYRITDTATPINLMCDRATLAMATIKGNYMQRHAYYNDELRDNLLNEQELINSAEAALNEKQFYINLQPIYDAKEEKPMAAEALLRWQHPTKGFISPGVFIPLFEKNGFIAELDFFAWEEACKFLAECKKQGKPLLPISVNVSRLNFYSSDLCERIMGLVKKYDLEPDLIKLEITESLYMDNPHQLLDTMRVMQENGFKVLMDDFGSGYSSLNMLKDVPVDTLKIDMQFIRTLESSERAGIILTHVVHMGKALNMNIVAEGVETRNQFLFLKEAGCDCIQGYYFSKPLDVASYEALLESEIRRK